MDWELVIFIGIGLAIYGASIHLALNLGRKDEVRKHRNELNHAMRHGERGE